MRWSSELYGRMDRMPRRPEVPGLTGDAERAHRSVQAESRLLVIRALVTCGPLTGAELVAATALPATTTRNSLRELRELGYVELVDAGASMREIRYRLLRDKLTTDLLVFVGWVLSDAR